MRSIIGIGLLGMIFLSGCVFLDDSFHKKELRSFALLRENNPALRRDYVGEILPNRKILIDVPNYVDAGKLVPRIEWEGVALEVDGSPYIDSEARDFFQPITIRVIGKDNELVDYRVEATVVPPLTTKEITRLYFVGSPSPFRETLLWESPFDGFDGERVFEVPFTSWASTQPFDPRSLIFGMVSSGLWTELDGQPYQRGSVLVDFSVPHTLSITAEDLSANHYVVKAQYGLSLRGFLITRNHEREYTFSFNREETQTWQVENEIPLDQARLVIHGQDTPYPVKLSDGTTITPDHQTIVDLTEPLTLTMQGPFLSRTATLRFIPE